MARKKLTKKQKQYQTLLLEEFAKLNLPLPKKWQWNFLLDLTADMTSSLNDRDYLHQYILCGAYGVGKTTIVLYACFLLMLWHNITFNQEKFKAVVISGSEDQLFNVFWRDLQFLIDSTKASDYFDSSKRLCCLKQNKFISLAPRVTNIGNLHSLAGIHADTVFVVLEEAPAIPKEAFDKIRTFFSNTRGFLFITGNPVRRDSFFYDIMEDDTGRYDQYNKYRIGRADVCKDITQDPFTQRIVKEYGEDSDDYRIAVLGKHGLDSTDAMFPGYVIDAFLQRPHLFGAGPYFMGVDVSTGGASDYSVIVVRNATGILSITRVKVEYLELTRMVNEHISFYMPQIVGIDENGVGYGLHQMIRALVPDINIIGASGGKCAEQKERFANQRTELFGRVKDWLLYHGSHAPDVEHIDILKRELRLLRASSVRGQRYKLEPKENLPESPDVADALSYSFLGSQVITGGFSLNSLFSGGTDARANNLFD